MRELKYLVRRNIKLFFHDKGMFLTALITPLILLMLYSTFLGNVYKDSFESVLASFGVSVEKKVLGGLVGGQLFSSLLAVSTVTVAFCANMLMVQDKVSGAAKDLSITPVKPSVLSVAYYIATTVTSLIISLVATLACIIYLLSVGWYLSVADIIFILIDVVLMVSFGTAFSSVINFFLSTQGQISAVGTIISSCYGFICGAYMPLSQLSEGLKKAVSFLPGTYGTSLFRKHAMRGAFRELEKCKVPEEVIDGLKESVDYDVIFLGEKVPIANMYIYLTITVALLLGIYITLNIVRNKKKTRTLAGLRKTVILKNA